MRAHVLPRRRKSINVLKDMFRDELSKDDWRLVIKLKKVGRGGARAQPKGRLRQAACVRWAGQAAVWAGKGEQKVWLWLARLA